MFCNIVPVERGCIQGQLVGNIAEKGLVQLLIEGGVEFFLQESIGTRKPFAGHLGGSSCLGADHVETAGFHESEEEVNQSGNSHQRHEQAPESSRTDKERSPGLQDRCLYADESDIAGEVLHVLASVDLHRHDVQGILRRCAPLLDRERQLTAGKGDIFSRLCIIVAELDRRYGKIAITAGYERVLEALSSLDIGGFHVILLEIRREVDLRSL